MNRLLATCPAPKAPSPQQQQTVEARDQAAK
jgi:hypothetical protein